MKEIIQSRQNPKVRFVCGLCEKKHRRTTGLFRFDGIKLCREAASGGLEIHSVYVRCPLSRESEELLAALRETGRLTEEQIVLVSEGVFEKLSEEKSPEGILTVARIPENLHRSAKADEAARAASRGEHGFPRILLAESLRDPGNLGTVLRTCGALGIDLVLLSADCADLYHPRTVRSAMGALFRLPVVQVEGAQMPELVTLLRRDGRRVFAAALCENAKEIGRFPLQAGDCFIIGNEGHGLSENLIRACDAAAVIPMAEGNESLNAAAAAAICVWETVKQA